MLTETKYREVSLGMPMDLAPLSPRQQGLWLYDRIESARGVYNVTMAFELRGQIDPELLSRTLAILVDRHEALHTNFVTVLGETYQRALPGYGDFSFPTVDLTRGSPQHTAEQLADNLREERRAPFDLSGTSPLIRARLLAMGEHHHVLVITAHHIVFDGWSQRLVLRELGELYRRVALGRGAAAQPPACTFSDYTRWQREWMAGGEAEIQAAYWAEQLADVAPLLPLPTDRPRPIEQDYDGGRVPFSLDKQLTAALKAFADQHRVTLYALLLTGWSVLLSRLSGRDDVVIGVPTANRRRSQDADVVGYFVNSVAVRVNLSDALGATALCQHTHATLREALAHSELPFERVVEQLNPPRSLSHSPIFQTLVAQVVSGDGMLELPGVEASPIDLPDTFAMFDLTLGILEESDPVRGYIDYATGLFDEETVRRFGKHLVHVLRQLVAEPDRRLVDISLLDADEQANLTRRSFGDGYPDGSTAQDHSGLVERFAAHVANRPTQQAVVGTDQQLTYLELDRRANGMAHALAKRGVGPGQVVAIYADRSAQLLVGILGVLKSGAAYLPLDCSQPVERLSAMVEDAAPAVVLSCVDGAAPHWDAVQLSEIASDRPEAPHVGVSPRDLAYVIYTSGSTGRPKGVAVTHASVLHLFDYWLQQFGATPGEATSAWASVGFDASVHELLLPLTTGAVLHMVPEDVRNDPRTLLRWMKEHHIVQAFLPPSYINWIGEDPHARLSGLSLRQVLTGVEALSESTLVRLQQALPGLRILFGYGPTEATLYASAHVEFKPLNRSCPIGRPLPGTRMYVLDRHLRPAPPMVVGEIYLAGTSLARGYLHRPGLTVERFVPDPFVAGERMFRTGDLARRWSDGNVEYVGRSDDQIKLRGFRIELGEVQAALCKIAETPEVVVLVDHGPSGEKRLVAGIGCGEAATTPPGMWRTALSALLPDYMIPEVFVQLPQLPVNRSGKLDRDALLAQARAECQAAVNTESPRDHVEMTLYRLWSGVLQHPHIGISDNFFEIGGTSVLAVKLASAIEQEFRRELPIRELMLRPTIEHLAVTLRADRGVSDEEPVIEFRAGNGRERVVCVHPAGGTAFCYLPLSPLLPERVGVVGVQSPGVNPGGTMAATVEEMARAYLEKIRPRPDEALVICGLSFGAVVAYEMARQLAAARHARLSAVLLDARIAEDAATREALAPVGLEEFRQKLVRFNGAYPEISNDQLERYFCVYNHNRMTLKNYLPQTSSARMVYVQASDAESSTDDIAAAWQRRSAGPLRFEQVDAGHWEMLEGSSLGRVAEIITDELATIADLAATQQVS
jgi:amino acid adenylation domain-containing protein